MRSSSIFCAVFLCAAQMGCSTSDSGKESNTIITNSNLKGRHISMTFSKGSAWGAEVKFGPMTLKIKPQIAIWVEDSSGNFKQNIYVTRCFAKQKWYSIKNHPDSTYRTSSLPYWMNKLLRASQPLPTQAHPLPDAVTAATPSGSFTIESVIDPSIINGTIWCEFNSSFDNNEKWPADKKAKESFNGQPSLVYKGDLASVYSTGKVVMNYAGHGGDTGTDGTLYENDSGITSAKEIITEIGVRVK